MREAHPAPLAPWLQPALAELLRQRGHAWLLQGPSGLGQYELALALASAWLCEAPTPAGACGQCVSCHAIAVRTHADLCVLMPETVMQERGWPLDEKTQTELDDKKRKPSREIRVEAMRDAVSFAHHTSARGRGKVVLVYPAERMNTITANALLKTLEEPVGEMRFVLASEAAWQLLPTIRSRCLGYTLPWPSEDAGQSWLEAQDIPAQEAQALLRAAGGRPSDALYMARAGRSGKIWSQWPRAMLRGDASAFADQTPAQVINALQKLCHDLLVLSQSATPRFFPASELPPPPSIAALSAWAQSLANAAKTADHPFNTGLMIEALASEARSVLNSAVRS